MAVKLVDPVVPGIEGTACLRLTAHFIYNPTFLEVGVNLHISRKFMGIWRG